MEIQPVHPERNQPWIFIGRTDAEAETPILWPPHAKSQLIGKDPNAEEDWRQEEKGTTEDDLVAWHDWLLGHEFEQAPRVGDGMQQSMGLQRIRHCWATELNWTEEKKACPLEQLSKVGCLAFSPPPQCHRRLDSRWGSQGIYLGSGVCELFLNVFLWKLYLFLCSLIRLLKGNLGIFLCKDFVSRAFLWIVIFLISFVTPVFVAVCFMVEPRSFKWPGLVG